MTNFIRFITNYSTTNEKMMVLIDNIKEDNIVNVLLDNAEIKTHIMNKLLKADYELLNEFELLFNDFKNRL